MAVCAQDGCPEQVSGGYCAEHDRTRRSPSSKVTSTAAWKRVRIQVLDRDKWLCVYCGRPANTVDHVDPVIRGGDSLDPANLVAACGSCNYSKGAK
jgi:5-methylcytosine-specific restriction endonuclease McrA